MSRANTSSIDSGKGYKLAHLQTQVKSDFQTDSSNKEDQIINAKKASTLAQAKAKAKKRAKLAKASKKKNKK
ncbi:MAG: hypothetical protein U9N52_08465 [Campylobacterota bacterium]|nr:hypothetical protein [Campylobacterota bacterium]